VKDTEPKPGSEAGRSGGARPHPFFLDLAPEYRDPERAAACILPIPYDATSSWVKGAGRGPAALISASNYVEVWDIETATEPYRHGIATLPPVQVDGPPDALADAVERRVGIGAVRAAAARVPGLSVLQIDAHADTRETYGGSAYNHACVMARVRECCPIVQVGIRSLDTSELEGLDGGRVFFAHEIAAERAGAEDPSGARPWMERASGLLSEDVYVTIDVDGFDPSVMPATGTPA
jgi:agmatinase